MLEDLLNIVKMKLSNNMRLHYMFLLTTVFFLGSCKQKENVNTTFLDFVAMEGIKIRYFIDHDSIKVIYPTKNTNYFIRENKFVEKINYDREHKELEIQYYDNLDSITANAYENIVSAIEFTHLNKISKVEYYTDIEKRKKHKTLALQDYYLNGNIKKVIFKTDSLVNNKIDSLPCHNLVSTYFQNGQLKSKGCGTNYKALMTGGTPVGLYNYYDSIGTRKISIFYHVNDNVFKGYKIITQYDKKGTIISKVKTLNEWLDDIDADTLKVYK